MSALPGNQFEDQWRLDAAEDTQYSLECAILSLAYEQRTANLIAYYQLWQSCDGQQPNVDADAEMQQRLGLRPEVTP